jgi:hypothetical protein
MTSSIVFIHALPPEWREKLKPYQVDIAGYWQDEGVCYFLFCHVGEDYYDWISKEGRIYFEPKLQAFLNECLDYIDDSEWEDGIDIYDVIKGVADNHAPSPDASGSLRDIWLAQLVQNAISLPIEE